MQRVKSIIVNSKVYRNPVRLSYVSNNLVLTDDVTNTELLNEYLPPVKRMNLLAKVATIIDGDLNYTKWMTFVALLQLEI